MIFAKFFGVCFSCSMIAFALYTLIMTITEGENEDDKGNIDSGACGSDESGAAAA